MKLIPPYILDRLWARVPRYCQRWWPNRLWHVETNEKALYLTFDDGPTPEVTAQVLDLLKTYQAKASFFVLGKNAEVQPQLIHRILNEGHSIGNHGYAHRLGWKTPLIDYVKDVQQATQVLQHYRHPQLLPKMFRPPYGRLTGKQAKTLHAQGYQLVMWEQLSLDYIADLNTEKALERLKKNTRKGTVIVFHDSQKAAKNVLPLLSNYVQWAHQNGWEMKPMPVRSSEPG